MVGSEKASKNFPLRGAPKTLPLLSSPPSTPHPQLFPSPSFPFLSFPQEQVFSNSSSNPKSFFPNAPFKGTQKEELRFQARTKSPLPKSLHRATEEQEDANHTYFMDYLCPSSSDTPLIADTDRKDSLSHLS